MKSSVSVSMKTNHRTFDLNIPLKERKVSQEPRPETEDKALTAFLESAIEEALSVSLAAPACLRCQSGNTALLMRPREGRPLPAFHCRDCDKWFNRMTGTPLHRMARVDALPEFIRLLSQQTTYQFAVQRTGLDERIVSTWVKKFRAWLLRLDPDGYWEAKVRLGIRPPDAVLTCPECGCHGPVIFFGYSSKCRGRVSRGERGRQFRCRACGRCFREHRDGEFRETIEASAPTANYQSRGELICVAQAKISDTK